MNQTQKNYAIERLNNIVKTKREAIEERHTTPAIRLSDSERFIAFKKGEYTVRTDVEKRITPYTDVMSIVRFKAEKPKKIDQKAISTEVKKLEKEAAALRDELMLGDGDKALELIKKFSA